jgi:hypothetical protein
MVGQDRRLELRLQRHPTQPHPRLPPIIARPFTGHDAHDAPFDFRIMERWRALDRGP